VLFTACKFSISHPKNCFLRGCCISRRLLVMQHPKTCMQQPDHCDGKEKKQNLCPCTLLAQVIFLKIDQFCLQLPWEPQIRKVIFSARKWRSHVNFQLKPWQVDGNVFLYRDVGAQNVAQNLKQLLLPHQRKRGTSTRLSNYVGYLRLSAWQQHSPCGYIISWQTADNVAQGAIISGSLV